MPKPNPVVWVHKPNYAVVVPRPKNKPQLFGNINNKRPNMSMYIGKKALFWRV